MTKGLAFYSVGDEHEELYYTTEDEAIENYLDGENPQLAAIIELCGWRRKRIDPNSVWGPLESLLEGLDEEYGGGDENTEPSEKMKYAERQFIEAVLAEYVVWQCEVVERENINSTAWIREHRPDWLAPRKES